MRIEEYFGCENQEHWLSEISSCSWSAGQYLYELLRDHMLKKLCGESTIVLMLEENGKLLSFCTLAEEDDIRGSGFSPWIGFVYTFPEKRGCRYAGKLLQAASDLAGRNGNDYVYISTMESGLYEKYGFSFYRIMKDINGEDSRVYRKYVGRSFSRQSEKEADGV